MITISIIICTYNRSQLLTKFLNSLLDLNIDTFFDYEIILVDNNSNDNTKEVVESFISRNNKIRYIFEPKQGISNARNTGINHSKGEVLAFTDDDVLLDKNWLLNIAHFCCACDFDGMGGKILPLYPKNAPQWIKDCKDLLNGPIVYHYYGETVQLYNKTMLPFVGANMVIKKKMFEELGGFDVNFGPGKGTMGDDTECFFKLRDANKKIYYNPNVLIHHPVEKSRMNLIYIAKWNMAYGKFMGLKMYETENKNVAFLFGAPRYKFRQLFNYFFEMMPSIMDRRAFVVKWAIFFNKIGIISVYQTKAKESIIHA